MAGRAEGIEIVVSARADPRAGWTTRVDAVPRVALSGAVLVRRARLWERVGPWWWGAARWTLGRALTVRQSSPSVGRAVLDARVRETVARLGPALVELRYARTAIALVWSGVEPSPARLADAIDCVAYLAVGLARTPYR
jgi:hypothetical protein